MNINNLNHAYEALNDIDAEIARLCKLISSATLTVDIQQIRSDRDKWKAYAHDLETINTNKSKDLEVMNKRIESLEQANKGMTHGMNARDKTIAELKEQLSVATARVTIKNGYIENLEEKAKQNFDICKFKYQLPGEDEREWLIADVNHHKYGTTVLLKHENFRQNLDLSYLMTFAKRTPIC